MMYRAPEMVDLYSGKVVDHRVDVWALGCVLFTIAFGKVPRHPHPHPRCHVCRDTHLSAHCDQEHSIVACENDPPAARKLN